MKSLRVLMGLILIAIGVVFGQEEPYSQFERAMEEYIASDAYAEALGELLELEPVEELEPAAVQSRLQPEEVSTLSQSIVLSANTLPDEVFRAVTEAPYDRDVYNVFGMSRWSAPILKVRELNFAPNGTLELHALAQNYLIIYAERLVFVDPLSNNIIGRNTTVVATAGTGYQLGSRPPKPPLPPASGTQGRTGRDGAPGQKGGTRMLPTVVLFIGEVATQAGDPPPERLNLSLVFPGIQGGEGGRGQDGGTGGRGFAGRNGSDGFLFCRARGQDGGRGGTAGRGGRGGNGGDGGNGATILVVGSSHVLNQLAFVRVSNEGGPSGAVGFGGQPGTPGQAGRGGRGSRFCHGGQDGRRGSTGTPPSFGPGEPGSVGQKGNAIRIERQIR
jgi:hypothetical protein